MRLVVAALCGAVAFSSARVLNSGAVGPCEVLAELSLPNTTLLLTETVPEGEFVLPSGSRPAARYGRLPAFCRVAARLTPSSDSDIRIEIWLPIENWNEKLMGVGNGGFAGRIAYGGLMTGIGRGYAVVSTDTGHRGGGGAFALGHPERVADFAYRAVHEMTIKAKAVIEAFYGNAASHSYWNGCSAGGGQGVMEAHRFPEDYDGIVAGAPGSPLSHGYAAWLIWVAAAALEEPTNFIPPEKYASINEATIQACDGADGLEDGIIDRPDRCSFDPSVLACTADDHDACLTAPQVQAVRMLFSPATNPRTEEVIFPPLTPGSELGWDRVIGGPEAHGAGVDAFRYIFLQDPSWDWRTMDFDHDVALADSVIEEKGLHAMNPDLRAFADLGAKLLLYHGWSDPINAPLSTVNFYDQARSILGDTATSNSVRLFMAPGMGHCGGGEGPNSFDALGALERWVEDGLAPDRIIAARRRNGEVDRTRPLCPYPQVARYTGRGSIDVAENFQCTTDPPDTVAERARDPVLEAEFTFPNSASFSTVHVSNLAETQHGSRHQTASCTSPTRGDAATSGMW